MVERPPRGTFPGLHVFPGGAVDPEDDHLPITGSPEEGLATALRETAEEVGLFLTDAGLVSLPVGPVGAVLEAAGRRFDGVSPVPLARWITPDTMPYRFDAAFHVAATDVDIGLRPQPEEVVSAGWVPVAEAVGFAASGEWPMVVPTSFHLRWLDQFDDGATAMAAARERRRDPLIPVIENDQIDLPSWITESAMPPR